MIVAFSSATVVGNSLRIRRKMKQSLARSS
jgi:hypothetical protein